MVRIKRRTRAKTDEIRARKLPFHAFWSGSLSFGLVNVPVQVFPATRHSGVRLRMLSPGGSFLERRFFCPRDDKEVSNDEIVRGYELEDGSYVVVTDQELSAIEPDKTREIDLREFVDLTEVAPAFLERGYYLTPLKEGTKAYRLLADVMEKTGRAGIATFVMRDREYLVAIFAENGILCAETLRFHDEIKSPEEVGLSKSVPVPRQRIAAFERAIDALSKKELPRESLVDQDAKRLRAVIEKKKRAGKDLIRMDHEVADGDSEEDGGDIDLLTTIRQSLRHTAKGHKVGARAYPMFGVARRKSLRRKDRFLD
jgi:DNA end-binding protein Ku